VPLEAHVTVLFVEFHVAPEAVAMLNLTVDESEVVEPDVYEPLLVQLDEIVAVPPDAGQGLLVVLYLFAVQIKVQEPQVNVFAA
jgi:hypothetical protein